LRTPHRASYGHGKGLELTPGINLPGAGARYTQLNFFQLFSFCGFPLDSPRIFTRSNRRHGTSTSQDGSI
jgi:hypothetical protein